jgi:hypothetical protein
MSGSRREIWKEILNRFDPELATRPEWRADRDDSPASKIITSLDRPTTSHPKVLLSGTIGIGKSTELYRVAEARAQKGDEFVIVLDLVRHFRKVVGDLEALQNVSSWEVCFLAALALIRAAKDRLGYEFPPAQLTQLAQAWTDIARAAQGGGAAGATPPTIDILAVVKSMTLMASAVAVPTVAAGGGPAAVGAAAAGGLKVLSEIAGAGKWTLPFGRKGTRSLEDQDELMQTLADRVNLLLATFQQWSRRVLFVIDGLDRIVDGERAKSLFLRSQMIARLDCALVICAPFALRNDMAATEARGFRLRTLHNAPVLDHKNPKNPGPGVRFLSAVFGCRVHDLGAKDIVPTPLLEKLAYYSGGRLRDFVRSIGMLAERGWDDDAAVATSDHVDDVLKEARQLVETGLDRGHIAVLEEVARDRDHRLPDGDLSRELLTYGRLLPYPNESEWFYPHPLLTLNLVQVPA